MLTDKSLAFIIPGCFTEGFSLRCLHLCDDGVRDDGQGVIDVVLDYKVDRLTPNCPADIALRLLRVLRMHLCFDLISHLMRRLFAGMLRKIAAPPSRRDKASPEQRRCR
jgi:hypothetical protein